MNKPLIITESNQSKLKNIRKICFDKNATIFLATDINSAIKLLNNSSIISAVIIDLYMPLNSSRVERPNKVPNGLNLAIKCFELKIPFLIISNDDSIDLSYLKGLIKIIETHQNSTQNNIPIFLGKKNWELIISQALSMGK